MVICLRQILVTTWGKIHHSLSVSWWSSSLLTGRHGLSSFFTGYNNQEILLEFKLLNVDIVQGLFNRLSFNQENIHFEYFEYFLVTCNQDMAPRPSAVLWPGSWSNLIRGCYRVPLLFHEKFNRTNIKKSINNSPVLNWTIQDLQAICFCEMNYYVVNLPGI